MAKGPYLTYFFGTEKEIQDFYNSKRANSKRTYTFGAVAELASAYLLCYAFPVTSICLAADGVARLIKNWKSDKKSASPGLVGIIRENF